MPVRLFGHTCAKCGADHTKASAWAEKDGEFYCHRRPCLREAGVPSAQLKRQRQEQPRVAPVVAERPAGGVLVEVKEVLGQRFVDAAGLEDWQLCNEIAERRTKKSSSSCRPSSRGTSVMSTAWSLSAG